MRSGKNSDSENTRKTVRLRPRAEKEVFSILVYLAADRPSAAVRFDERFEETKELLGRMPLLGRVARSTRMLRKGYRCFVMDDYLVYYKVEGGVVRIWHITHSVRRPADNG